MRVCSNLTVEGSSEAETQLTRAERNQQSHLETKRNKRAEGTKWQDETEPLWTRLQHLAACANDRLMLTVVLQTKFQELSRRFPGPKNNFSRTMYWTTSQQIACLGLEVRCSCILCYWKVTNPFCQSVYLNINSLFAKFQFSRSKYCKKGFSRVFFQVCVGTVLIWTSKSQIAIEIRSRFVLPPRREWLSQ